MHNATGTPEPEDISALISGAEAHLAAHAPVEQPAPTVATAAPPAAVSGETKRVRKLRAEHAEAGLLAELQADDTPLRLDSTKVRKRRRAAYEAARLHELAQDPMMKAWQASRMRKLLVGASMVSLTLALSWSTAGVQGFAAEGAPAWSPVWILAWLVEPFMSIALLVVVGARAYMATQGQPIQSKTLTRIEYLFLGLTLGMNAWRHLPGVADHFEVSALVLHILGPVIAVAIVTALPIVLAAFTTLDHDTPMAAERKPAGNGGHIERDQRFDTPSKPKRAPRAAAAVTPSRPDMKAATNARRATGEQTRARVADHMAANPGHSVQQIADALGLSVATVKRHRRTI
ncbi:helix-turn-helix domain-containing protein [Nonomuraea maritima]|uniref:helix-turn-helix domain-containing protein n=1 Tax=Nonomuraea maritima TaxID=683260 RepID=UPI003721B47C